MTRAMIPIPMKMTTINMQTGAETPSVIEAKMMPAPEGTCALCAHPHDESQPHNAQSLFYQMRFQAEHGRAPDWRDAMQHCEPDVKRLWKEALAGAGVDVDAGQVNPEKRG